MSVLQRCRVLHGVLSAFIRCLLLLFVVLLPSFGAPDAAPRAVKRVLLLYSDNVKLPFAQIQDEVFRTRLSNLPQDVQIFSENLDSSLFETHTPDFLVADLYQQKYDGVRFDVLIAIRPPALQFLITHRDDIFGNVPIVFCNVAYDEPLLNRLPAGVTGATIDYSLTPSLNLILQLQPETERIAVVLGAASRETEMLGAIESQAAPFADRVAIDYWIGLTADELRTNLAGVSPRTAILYLSDSKDRLGHAFVPRDLLAQLTSWSTVPIYSIATTYLGTGTIGGWLVDPTIDAGMATDLVARILNGENPRTLKIALEPARYAFDSRVLKRFQIPESRLPPGSEVLFRELGPWTRYWPYILAGIFFLFIETALVAMLLFEKRRAGHARRLLERRFAIEKVISECSTKLSECPANKVNEEIERGLRALLQAEEVDTASWLLMDVSDVDPRNIFSVHRPSMNLEPVFFNRPELPWITKKILRGESVAVAKVEDLPPEAHADRTCIEQRRVKSVALIPSSHLGSRTLLVLVRIAEYGEWPAALLDRLNVLGNVFANALMRKQAQEAGQQSEERFRYLFTEAPIGIALEDLEGRLLFVNPSLCSMLGYTKEELTSMNCSQFADPEDEKEDWAQFQAMRAGITRSYQIEKRYLRKDGSRMWGRLNVSMVNSFGHATLVLATVEDITETRAAVEELKRAHSELRTFTPRLISAQEEERKRIARELHDDVGQRLLLLMMNLDSLGQQIPSERILEHTEIGNLQGQLDLLIRDIHNLSHQLHSSTLPILGLNVALRDLCRQLGTQHHVAINLVTEEFRQPLPDDVSLCFYRVAQEALTNAIKHSNSSRVDVHLFSEGQVLRLQVKDFGVGFDSAVPRDGLGLVTMQERLRMVGGLLRFNSIPGGGTEVEAEATIEKGDLSTKVA